MTILSITAYILLASLFYGYLKGSKFYLRNRLITNVARYILSVFFPLTLIGFFFQKSTAYLSNLGKKAGTFIAEKKEKKAVQKKQRIAIEEKIRIENLEASAQAEAELEMEFARLDDEQVNKKKKQMMQLASVLDKTLFPRNRK